MSRRVTVLAVGLSVVLFFCFHRRWAIPAGVLAGVLLSLYKIRLYSRILKDSFGREERRKPIGAILSGTLSMFFTLGVLTAAIVADRWLFMGITVGMLLHVTVIFINIITEAAGLTHNRWEKWF